MQSTILLIPKKFLFMDLTKNNILFVCQEKTFEIMNKCTHVSNINTGQKILDMKKFLTCIVAI